MLNGWIKIPRNVLEWDWWDKPEMVVLYLYMLASAKEENTLWHSKEIKKGQFVVSLSSIERDNPKLTKKIIRTCLKRFQETGVIKIESTNKYSIITICNYEDYQCSNGTPKDIENGQVQKVEQQQSQEAKKEIKPKKTKVEIIEATKQRAQTFYNSLIPFVSTYGKEMVREFYDYWSEPNKSNSKLRYEQEKTWDLSRRLARWSNHNKEYNSNESKKTRTNDQAAAQRVGEATNLVESLLSSQG